MPAAQSLWIYRDPTGNSHVAQALEDIPEALRGTAQQLDKGVVGQVLNEAPGAGSPGLMVEIHPEAGTSGATRVHLPSYLLGVGEAVLAVLTVQLMLKTHFPNKIALSILLLLAFAIGYVTFVHWQTSAPFPHSGDDLVEAGRAAMRAAGDQLASVLR